MPTFAPEFSQHWLGHPPAMRELACGESASDESRAEEIALAALADRVEAARSVF